MGPLPPPPPPPPGLFLIITNLLNLGQTRLCVFFENGVALVVRSRIIVRRRKVGGAKSATSISTGVPGMMQCSLGFRVPMQA